MTDPAGGAKVKPMPPLSEENLDAAESALREFYEAAVRDHDATPEGCDSRKGLREDYILLGGVRNTLRSLRKELDAAREEARNAYTVGYANGNADHQEDRAALKSIQGALVDSGLPVGPQEIWADTVRALTAERDAAREEAREAALLVVKASCRGYTDFSLGKRLDEDNPEPHGHRWAAWRSGWAHAKAVKDLTEARALLGRVKFPCACFNSSGCVCGGAEVKADIRCFLGAAEGKKEGA